MYSYQGIGTTLYGKKNRRTLSGTDADAAGAAGFKAESYQAVKWFIVFFLPIAPLGTYRVRPAIGSTDLEGKYLMEKLRWDWKQIGLHYLALASGVGAVPLIAALVLKGWL